MRKIALIGLAMFLFASWASAQVPTSGNVFFGYSFENSDSTTLNVNGNRTNLQGWEASLEGKLLPWVGIVADLSGHYGSENFAEITPDGPLNLNVSAHELEVLFGPRVSVSVGKFRPFAEAEVGVGHVNTNNFGSDTSIATALGGGIDYKIMRLLAWRLQGDYIGTRFYGTTQSDFRLSTGIVVHF